jgi:outer membrane protein OmpA-like peptidoglycan-associated protein
MKSHHQHHDPVSNSMTDLMTSLAVIFILLMVAYLNKTVYEAKTAKRVITQLMTGTKTKRDGLKDTLASLGIAAEVDPKDPLALIIHIGEDKLQFDHDRSELKPEGKLFLQGFVPKLAMVLSTNQFKDDLQSVLIEGHTDSDGEDEHNLRLSQDRSYAVLLFALNDCKLTGNLRSGLLRLISASGRGESDLVSNPTGEESKERSRRVAVKIRVKSIEQKPSPELERILGSKA